MLPTETALPFALACPARRIPRRGGIPVAAMALLALAGALAAGPAAAYEPDYALCSPDPLFPFYRQPVADSGDRLLSPTRFSALRFDVSDRQRFLLEGEVEVERADQRLLTERLRYDTQGRRFSAEGGVQYQDSEMLLEAASAEGDLDADRTTLEDIRYQLLSARGNGTADSAELVGKHSELDRVTYSTCDPDQRSWEIAAREIDIDHDEGVGRARGATLRIGRVPVIYLPWATFPVDDRRRTGFLYPSIGYDDESGIDLRIPYYINLAPNYDATLNARVLGRRGVMLGAEFRYLTQRHRGIFDGQWLPDDDIFGDDRSLVRFRHDGRLSPGWLVRADINSVSDDRWFEDFGDSLSLTSTTLLGSEAGVYGRGAWWDASVVLQSWDVTDPLAPASREPFRRLPRARYEAEHGFGPLRAGVRAEAVAFDHRELAGAKRYDLHPYLSLPFERAAGFVRPELGYRYTSYSLDRDWLGEGFTDTSPDRGTAVFSLDSGLVFERSARLFGEPALQTLEPRLYYLYVPYEDQGDLPLFDTRELSFSMAQLFRSNRFSGADRQSDANQATLALFSRFYDESSGRERLSLGLGQVRYFRDLRVQIDDGPAIDRSEGSAYVLEAGLDLDERWRVQLSQQWDPETDRTELSAIRAQYRFRGDGVANLGYRLRRDRFEQLDASVLVPINERWRAVARWNYSLDLESTIEAVAGFEWQGCCYAVRVLGRHYIRNREGEKNNALLFELELKGLGSLGRRTEEFLSRAILGYSR